MWSIAIPSYQRSAVLRNKTLPFLQRHQVPASAIRVYVAGEEEARVYRETLLPDTYGEIVVGRLGITAQRNFISQTYPLDAWVVCMDDDIDDLLVLDGGRLTPMIDFKSFVDIAFTSCVENSRHLWGIYPVVNAMFMKPTTTTDMRFCIGQCFGYINQRMRLNAPIKTDYELTMAYSALDGGVVRFNWVVAKSRMGAAGGIGMARADRVGLNEQAIELFQRMYPDYFVVKRNKPGEILLKRQPP